STGGAKRVETTSAKVRNVAPIKINEFRDVFVELHNSGASDVDISNWSVTAHPTQLPIFSAVKIPAGTKVPAHGFYLLGLSQSRLAGHVSNGAQETRLSGAA